MAHERIVRDPKIMFGKPVLKGTRIPVEMILRKIGAGLADAEIIAQHPHLKPEDIRAAAAYAADYLAGDDVLFTPGASP